MKTACCLCFLELYAIHVTVQRRFSVTILFQEFENKRITLSTGNKKNYQKEGSEAAYILQFLSIHYNAKDIL